MIKKATQPLKNFASLGIVQATNYIMPLLTLPYIISVIGLERFGLITVAQSVMFYLIVLAEYGHGVTSTAEVALARQFPSKLNNIISITLFAKLVLVVASMALVLAICTFIPYFASLRILYITGFIQVLGQSFFPMWFFQGMERLKYITLLNFISRCLLTLLIFVLVQAPQDYLLILPIYGVGGVVASVVGWIIIVQKYQVKVYLPEMRSIIKNLQEGFGLFTSSLANNTSVYSGIIVLQFFASDAVVGMYAVLDKIILIYRQVVVIFGQSIYPTLCRIQGESSNVIATLRSVAIPFTSLILIGSFVMVLFPQFFTLVLTGKEIPEMYHLIRLLSPVPLIMTVGIIANHVLLAHGMKKIVVRIYLMGAVTSLTFNVILGKYFSAAGIVTTSLVVELFLAVCFCICVDRQQIFRDRTQPIARAKSTQ